MCCWRSQLNTSAYMLQAKRISSYLSIPAPALVSSNTHLRVSAQQKQQVRDALNWQNTGKSLRAHAAESSRWWCFQTRWCGAWLWAAWEVCSVYWCQTQERLQILLKSQRAPLHAMKIPGPCKRKEQCEAGSAEPRIIHFLHQKPFGLLRTQPLLPEGPWPFMALKMRYMTNVRGWCQRFEPESKS